MTELTAKLLVDCQNQLGEAVQWNPELGRVFWTDIFGNTLWSCDQDGQSVEKLALEDGLCAFAFASNDTLIAAFKDALCWLDLKTGKRTVIEHYQPDLSTSRMNDGGLDRTGRFIVGGIEETKMAPVTPVWSVAPGHIATLFDGVGCANSLVFSPDGNTMYFADTSGPDLFIYDYDQARGTASNRRFFARMGDQDGLPDGSTVDAKGGLWNARFGGAKVQRFLPNGHQDITVNLPVPNVTCCAIGGAGLDRMFITTARILMDDPQLAHQPSAGGLFVCDVPVQGIKAGRFKDLQKE